jgi:hypothetical protein
MRTTVISIVAATLLAAGTARTQEPPKAHDHGEQAMPAMPMMQHTDDEKLDKLVAEMNAAKGNDRIDRLVAVVNELVAERKAMREHMNGMMKGGHK